MPEEERQKGTEAIFEAVMTENLPKFTSVTENSENIKQDRYKANHAYDTCSKKKKKLNPNLMGNF